MLSQGGHEEAEGGKQGGGETTSHGGGSNKARGVEQHAGGGMTCKEGKRGGKNKQQVEKMGLYMIFELSLTWEWSDEC